jgi:hypothetical protein
VERLAADLDGEDLPPEDLILDLLKACDMDLAQEDRWMRVYDNLSGTDDQKLPPAEGRLGPRHAASPHWSGGKTTAAVGLALSGMIALFGHIDIGSEPATVSALPPGTPTNETPGLLPTPEPSTVPSSPGTTHITTGKPTSHAVTLGVGEALDLDAGPSTADVRWENGVLQSADYAKRLRLMDSGATPDAQACSKLRPGWLDRAISGLTAGQSLCVRTTDEHWLWISITAAGSSLAFTYTPLT